MHTTGKYFCLLLAGVMLLLWNTSALARTVYASPDGDDLNDGFSWTTAKRSIGAALQAARSGDSIWVRYGVYEERITLKDGVSLYGGFRGTEQTLTDRLPFPRPSPDAYETVLDGQQGGSVVTTPSSAFQTYRLDGFTVRNGKSANGGGLYCPEVGAVRLIAANCIISGNAATGNGGGVYCGASSAPTLTDCIVTGNTANYGGGVFCTSSSPTLTNCTINGNTTTKHGGGIYCTSSSPTLTNCTINGNSVKNDGGGVFCYKSSPTLTNCTIGENRAEYGGGVSFESTSHPTLTSCAIGGNTATNSGGGVNCSSSSDATLTDCTITGNTANYGGGLRCHSSDPVLTNCTISGNTADQGGGMRCYSSSPALTDCALITNVADYGGGIACYSSSSPTLTRCVVVKNDAFVQGGGVICESSSNPILSGSVVARNRAVMYGGGVYSVNSSPTLRNSILSQNTAYLGGALHSVSSTPSLSNCTLSHNVTHADGGAIASNGGGRIVNTLVAFNSTGVYYSAGAPTAFHHNCVWGNDAYNYSGLSDPTGSNGNISENPLMAGCHLFPGSPCLEAGDNAGVGSGWKDIDGEARIGGSRVDIGADELYAPIVQGWVTFSDYAGVPPLWVPFEVRTGSTEVKQILVDAEGGFVVPGVPAGECALSVKPLSYLRRTVDVDTSAGNVLGVQLELVNGDVDGDNEVTLFDFGRLVAAFGSVPNDENWDASADLDGDEEVTLFDFGILVGSFGEIGDD